MEELERIQSSEVVTSSEVLECIKDSLDCYSSMHRNHHKMLNHGRHARGKRTPKPPLWTAPKYATRTQILC